MESIKFHNDWIEKIGAVVENYKIYEDKFLLSEVNASNNFDLPARIEFGIIICTGGSAELSINFRPVVIKDRGIVINMLPNIIQVKSMSTDFKVKIILLEAEFAKTIIFDLSNMTQEMLNLHRMPYLELPHVDYAIFNKYYELMCLLIDSKDDESKSDSLTSLFSSLGYYMRRTLNNQDYHRDETGLRNEIIFQEFIVLASSSFTEEKAVNFYASHFSLTPKYFSQIIKQVSGKSASEWIDEFVLLESQSLLRHSSLSIQEIAYKLNFESASLYGRYFKSHMGVSPGLYRKVYQK